VRVVTFLNQGASFPFPQILIGIVRVQAGIDTRRNRATEASFRNLSVPLLSAAEGNLVPLSALLSVGANGLHQLVRTLLPALAAGGEALRPEDSPRPQEVPGLILPTPSEQIQW
jgi:hypothetical protein